VDERFRGCDLDLATDSLFELVKGLPVLLQGVPVSDEHIRVEHPGGDRFGDARSSSRSPIGESEHQEVIALTRALSIAHRLSWFCPLTSGADCSTFCVGHNWKAVYLERIQA
jgi:hypothetical protein